MMLQAGAFDLGLQWEIRSDNIADTISQAPPGLANHLAHGVGFGIGVTRPSCRAASNWPAVNSAAVVQRLPLHGKVVNCGRHHIGGARTALPCC